MRTPAAARLPRIRVVLGDVDLAQVDAVVRPVRPRHLAVGETRVRAGLPPVIEVASPTYSPRDNHEYLLTRVYRAALEAADALGARSIAVPTELTWAPWPIDSAIRIALGTLESTQTRVREVIVVTATPAGLEAWTERLARR